MTQTDTPTPAPQPADTAEPAQSEEAKSTGRRALVFALLAANIMPVGYLSELISRFPQLEALLSALGFFCVFLGLVFGPLAIVQATKAQRLGAPVPVARLLGWIATVMAAVAIIGGIATISTGDTAPTEGAPAPAGQLS